MQKEVICRLRDAFVQLFFWFWGSVWCGGTLLVPRHMHTQAHPRTGNGEQVVEESL